MASSWLQPTNKLGSPNVSSVEDRVFIAAETGLELLEGGASELNSV